MNPQEFQTQAVQVWIDEQEKLVSCHEIPGGRARQFINTDAFQAFILNLIGESFRCM